MKHKFIQLLTIFGVFSVSGSAMAHQGVHMSEGLLSGAMHPLFGLDHFIVILAVGLWASTGNSKQLGVPIIAFLGFMAAGAFFALAGFMLPIIESGIAVSALIIGLLLMTLSKFRAGGLGLIALVAFFHGQAHGYEMPASSSPVFFAVGFLTVTGLLQLAGLSIGLLLQRVRTEWLLRGTGALLGGTGAWMLLGA